MKCSRQAKWALMWYFLIKRHFLGCTTETEICTGFIADVLAITKDYHIYEIEIKTSKSDLKVELYTIRQILSNKEIPRKEWGAKYRKHKGYIHGKWISYWGPDKQIKAANKFYFAVPEALREIAIKGTQDTPYGVILLGKRHVVQILKHAKMLHKNKLSEYRIFKILHRASLENMNYLGNNL